MSEFEKTYEYEKERWEDEFEDGDYYTLSDVMETVNNLKSAYNYDMRAVGKVSAEMIEMQRKRIAELEAQLPNVVVPVYNCGDYDCPECERRSLYLLWRYCPDCGSKLDFTYEKK